MGLESFVRMGNPFIKTILGSPLHSGLGSNVPLTTVTGRKYAKYLEAALDSNGRPNREDGRLRLWRTNGACSPAMLLRAALSQRHLATRPLMMLYPAADVESLAVLEQYGFRPVRTLAHMKLDLGHDGVGGEFRPGLLCAAC